MRKRSRILVAVLIGIELLMLISMMLTARHQARLYRKIYPGVDPSQVEATQAQEMAENVGRAHNASAYRKMDLVVITYHIPILAMTAIFGAEWLLSSYAYIPLTIIVYFAIGWLLMRFFFRNGRSIGQAEAENDEANKRRQATV